MTLLKAILIFGLLAAPRIDATRRSKLPEQLRRALAIPSAEGIGQVEPGSMEEQIWRELGALPPSATRRYSATRTVAISAAPISTRSAIRPPRKGTRGFAASRQCG